MASGVKEAARPAGRPLRPLALAWAAFGVLPWAAATLMWPSDVLGKIFLAVEALAFLAVLLVVKDRVPVRAPRVATGASLLLFLLAVVRFGVLPFASERALSSAAEASERAVELTRILAFTAILGIAFVAASLVLLATCAHALWVQRRR